MRTKAERRHNDWKKAIRKFKKDKSTNNVLYYDNLHQYSKNKIHCSCELCKNKYRKHDKHTKKNKLFMYEDIKTFLNYNIAN